MLAGTNRFVDNCQLLTFRRNYKFENVRYIQLDFAFDRIYITFFYEDYKQQTYMAMTHERGHLEEMQEKAIEEYKDKNVRTIQIFINNKQIFKQSIL